MNITAHRVGTATEHNGWERHEKPPEIHIKSRSKEASHRAKGATRSPTLLAENPIVTDRGVTVMTIVDIGYIQSFGSFCNAIGALAVGQLADTMGPKTTFLFSSVIVSIYYSLLGFARCWYSFFFLQILRIGYQLDATAEMYLATYTVAIAMFFGPMVASQLAVATTLRTSQVTCGIAMLMVLTPTIYFALPQTHSIPKLATARLRPQLQLEEDKTSFTQANKRRYYPKTVLQLALTALIGSYFAVNFTKNLEQLLVIIAVQTASYAVAYAESCTQITRRIPHEQQQQRIQWANVTFKRNVVCGSVTKFQPHLNTPIPVNELYRKDLELNYDLSYPNKQSH
uniref:Major facilitator superfamily (MFS) profile domain-containing protein n=1 Tax=Parascaris equorum TaxID=6256 RepID=A0A914RVE2_PAREQ